MTGQDVLLASDRQFSDRAAGRSLIYIAKDRDADTGGDVDVDPAAAHKTLRRLWGEMKVTPSPPDGLLTTRWHTTIEIEPAQHKVKEAKERKVDVAERLVIAYLNKAKDQQARQADMTEDIADENEGVIERTLRRAIRSMLTDGLVHEVGGGSTSPIIKLGPAPEGDDADNS